MQWASELAPRGASAQGPVGVDQVRRVGHDLGLRRPIPTVGQRLRQALRRTACTLVFGETTEITGGEQLVVGTLPQRRGARRQFMAHVRPLPGRDRAPQDERPLRLAADQGQHRRRPDDDRGEGAGQHPEDRPQVCMVDGVLDKAEAPTGPGLWFMDSSSAAAEMVTLCAGVGLRRAFLPDRAGQRHRQSDPAGHQALRQSAHRAHHDRAHRRRRLRACCGGR